MSRAKVPADHAERCLGHVVGGVRGVYDRHEYLNEKAIAHSRNWRRSSARLFNPET
jgi:hypothetical protein